MSYLLFIIFIFLKSLVIFNTIFDSFYFFTNRSTLSVIAAYLDAFQKIADSATNAKGKNPNNFQTRQQISLITLLIKNLLTPVETTLARQEKSVFPPICFLGFSRCVVVLTKKNWPPELHSSQGRERPTPPRRRSRVADVPTKHNSRKKKEDGKNVE